MSPTAQQKFVWEFDALPQNYLILVNCRWCDNPDRPLPPTLHSGTKAAPSRLGKRPPAPPESTITTGGGPHTTDRGGGRRPRSVFPPGGLHPILSQRRVTGVRAEACCVLQEGSASGHRRRITTVEKARSSLLLGGQN